MGAMSGHEGAITGADFVTNVYSWSIDYTGEALESTDFGDLGVRAYIPGMTGWSGTYDCYLDDSTTTTPPAAASASAIFQMGTTTDADILSGDILITSVSYGVPSEGIETVSYSFTGTGALAIA